MNETDYLIIGGGIAGTTAAETIRNQDKQGSITIISEEPGVLYSRIMLSKPNFFLEKIPFDRVWLKTEKWYEEKNINLISNQKAVSLNAIDKTIVLENQQIIKYHKLLLSTGGRARKLKKTGADKKNIYYLRTLKDAQGIINAVKKSQRAVVVGGGFVGFEMTDMLKTAGLETSLIIREKNFWEKALDLKTSSLIEKEMKKAGVEIFKESEIEKILGEENVEEIFFSDGKKIPCDLLVIGIGLEYDLNWLQQAGIETNKGIVANEFMETNQPDIWTAGDAAEFNDLIIGEKVQLGNWANAQMQGIVAGKNMSGEKTAYQNITSYTTHGFGIIITFIGDTKLSSDRKILERLRPEKKSFTRLFLAQNELVGATLVNNQTEVGPLANLMRSNAKLSDKLEDVSNPDFDLKTLLEK